MNLKFLIVLTIVLTSSFILPVNAAINIDIVADSTPLTYNLGTISDKTVLLTFYKPNNQGVIPLPNNPEGIVIFISNAQNCQIEDRDPTSLVLNENANSAVFTYTARHAAFGILGSATVTINYDYNPSALPEDSYEIDIDLQENPIFELGSISSLEKTFEIGSSSNRVVDYYTSYASRNCEIIDLQRNYVKIKLNPYFNYGEIFLSGKAIGNNEVTDFTTKASFNYTYEEKEKINFDIECIDYDKGIQVIGANITVYYYSEIDDSLQEIYHNDYSNGLTRLEVNNNTDLFIEYNLNGYNAVNIDTFEYLDNRQGKIMNSNLGSARLYFSKIDPSVLLFQGFIIKDSAGRALSGVSVTMDNNQTIISNNYGGVQFDNINQGSHTFTFVKNGYYSQSLTKSVSVSNTQNILLQSTTAPTTAPTIAPTPIQTDSQGNIIIEKPNNIADSIKYGLAKIFGVYDTNAINLVFALLLILFPAVIGGSITGQALGFISGGLIGFVFALALGLIPIWVFFAMIMTAVIYLVLTKGQEGF